MMIMTMTMTLAAAPTKQKSLINFCFQFELRILLLHLLHTIKVRKRMNYKGRKKRGSFQRPFSLSLSLFMSHTHNSFYILSLSRPITMPCPTSTHTDIFSLLIFQTHIFSLYMLLAHTLFYTLWCQTHEC